MLVDNSTQGRVAPLKIRKSPRLFEESSDQESKNGSTSITETHTTEEVYSPRPKFQNFLRASYPFQPVQAPSVSTVTLPLAAGDIILIHSIHTNGWADGTLLETGARGWLPTNYCEPYDYATMRPMLKALTEFWDIVRSSPENDPGRFENHDYMRGMVAGVRFLLEKSDCLTRDAPLVRDHDGIRKTRKGLLADLSLLVKAAKQVHNVNNDSDKTSDMDAILDDMLLKAFQVVTRAVSFFDIWSEQVTFGKSSGRPSISRTSTLDDLPLAEFGSMPPYLQQQPAYPDLSLPKIRRSSAQPLMRQPLQTIPEDNIHQIRPRPASISRPTTMTHRMSYTNRSLRRYSSNLASEQLSSTYDAFLGVLASFLGSHMQSRSSSELLLTTQQAVKSCRRLLEVIEIIVEHDPAGSEGLLQAKDTMYDRITELVRAAQDVFRPFQADGEDMVYLPEEGMQLVNAATACVSGAGRCVAKARVLLEDIGDFELELGSDFGDSQSPLDLTQSPVKVDFDRDFTPEPLTLPDSGNRTVPRLEIFETDGPGPAVLPDTIIPTPESTSTYWTPILGRALTPSDSPTSSPEAPHSESTIHADEQRHLGRTAIHGSDSTLVSSARDSGPSVISQTSTRATSPEVNVKTGPKQIAEEEHEDGEEEVMEHQFAHQLLFNQESRVVGGTLDALIERLTAHDTTPDASFVSTIYLTFRLFAAPKEFAEALAYRFEYVEHTPRIAGPVRLRVTNVLKGWLESHWRHDCDESTLPFIKTFARDKVTPVLASAGKRLLELIETVATTHAPVVPRVLSVMGKTNTVSSGYVDPDQPLPPPVLSKSQLNSLKTWKMGGAGVSILDFEPVELARQLTLKTSAIYCSILPEELLGTEFQKRSSSLAVNVRAMSTLSTDLANLVADSILQVEEAKKRAVVIKQWIKIAAKCLELNNYDTLMAIVCSINSSTISRLRRTWTLIGQKTKAVLEELKKVVDVAKNYSVLRQRISGHVPPCLPFVGMYLTDLTFVDHGNPATRQLKTGDESIAVINLDKHMKTAKIISDLQRFQIPYRLTEVSELQTWLQDEFVRVRAAGERNFQNHYRRSLVLEPREQQAQQKASKVNALAAVTTKDRFDFLGWTHINKEKTSPQMVST